MLLFLNSHLFAPTQLTRENVMEAGDKIGGREWMSGGYALPFCLSQMSPVLDIS